MDRARFRRDHRWARGRLSDFLDGELRPDRRARLERHLGECDRCRRLLAGLHRTVDALHRLADADETVDWRAVAAAVRARLQSPG